MLPDFELRIAYGRSIRQRAECLIDAHGDRAATEAELAAAEPGITEAERAFWEAVGARVGRHLACP